MRIGCHLIPSARILHIGRCVICISRCTQHNLGRSALSLTPSQSIVYAMALLLHTLYQWRTQVCDVPSSAPSLSNTSPPVSSPQLYQFTQRTFVSRTEMAEATRLPDDDVTDLLQQVAELVTDRGWRLRIKPDPQHERRYVTGVVILRLHSLAFVLSPHLMFTVAETGNICRVWISHMLNIR